MKDKRFLGFKSWYDLCQMINGARKLFWTVAFWFFIVKLAISCIIICILSGYYEYEYSHGRTYHRY